MCGRSNITANVGRKAHVSDVFSRAKVSPDDHDRANEAHPLRQLTDGRKGWGTHRPYIRRQLKRSQPLGIANRKNKDGGLKHRTLKPAATTAPSKTSRRCHPSAALTARRRAHPLTVTLPQPCQASQHPSQLVVDNQKSRVYSKTLMAQQSVGNTTKTVANNFRLESIAGQLRLVGLRVVVGVPAPVWGARAS
jgi:hypothetical protein